MLVILSETVFVLRRISLSTNAFAHRRLKIIPRFSDSGKSTNSLVPLMSPTGVTYYACSTVEERRFSAA